MKIIFVRHGLTKANIEKRYSTPDTVLEKSGLYILDKTKDLLKNYELDEVYASGLVRSQETARILGYDNFIVDKRLNEMDFGDFKGQRVFDVREKYLDFFEEEKDKYFDLAYPGGESRRDVINRLGSFLDEKSKEGKNILAISHGIAIRSSLFWVLRDLSNWQSFWIDNGSLTVFNIKDDKKLIESVNLI
ncbi:histidine phosphatase family protein [uncultured Anaerococcus sp.]|uniref:histidine phosphatase family protein n=1 Tax=uncultured Anaerococcus sp. TaxID=293428 RepID=UPI0025F66850|nr:histidine phosphatase family protein [uncultured Anaerococcus sp.]